jgi:beta-lactamase regulating signal transducer with metallopeptidase domain
MTSEILSSLLFGTLAKGVIVFLLANLAIVLMRRASAANRHFVWLCALTAALFLPLSAWLLPLLRALPNWLSWEQARVSANSPFPVPASVTAEEIIANVPTGEPGDSPDDKSEIPESPIAAVVEVTAESVSTPNRLEPVSTRASPEVVDAPEREPPIASSFSASPERRIPVQHTKSERSAISTQAFGSSWLLAAWCIGCFVLLIPLMLSAIALRRRVARSRWLREGAVVDHVAAVQQELGLRRPVRVFLSTERAMPMVWGVFRGNLLLPDEAANWPRRQLRTVLLHELSHLKRRDPLGLLVAHLALAIHWTNPLAWIALRGLRAGQEAACDDAVLRHDVRPSDYAAEMLAMTKQLCTFPVRSTALTMARRGMIEERIAGILDTARHRGALTRRVAMGFAILAASIAIPLAMLRAGAQDEPNRDAASEADPSFDQLKAKLREISAEPWKSDRIQRIANVADQMAKLDPEKALALAEQSTEDHSLQLTAAGIRELTRNNAAQMSYDSIVKRVNAMPVIDHRDAAAIAMVRAAAERDPDGALKLLPRFRIRSDVRKIAIVEVLDDLIDRDLEKAAAYAVDFDFRHVFEVRGEAIHTIANLIVAKKGLSAALVWARSFKSLSDRISVRHSAIFALIKAAPEKVVEELMSIKEPGRSANAWSETLPDQRRQILESVFGTIKQRDPAAARAWAENLPANVERPRDWPPIREAPDTLKFAMSLPEGSRRRAEIIANLIPKFAKDDPHRALTLSLELPIKQRKWFTADIAKAWAEKDVEGAVAFLDNNPRLADGDGDVLVETLSRFAQRDLASAEAVVARSEKIKDDRVSTRVRESALRQIVYRFSPERAMELAGRLGKSEYHVAEFWEGQHPKNFNEWMVNALPKQRALGLLVLASVSTEDQPRKAAAHLIELDKLEIDTQLHYEHKRTIANTVRFYAAQNLEEAAEWASKLEDAASALIATEMIGRLWAVNHPGNAAKWISGLRKGAPRQSAALGFFAGLDSKSAWNSDLNWQSNPTAKQLRQQSDALISVVNGLPNDIRAPARVVLEILNNLKPAVQQRLLDELKQEEIR